MTKKVSGSKVNPKASTTAPRQALKSSAVEVVVAGRYACGGQQNSGDDSSQPQAGNREKKLFLSSKVTDQHKLLKGVKQSSRDTEADALLAKLKDDPLADSQMAPWKVKQFQSEVETLGMSGMDAKKQKAWRNATEESLGLKQVKRCRIPASIGRGMNAAQTKREEEAYEQAKLQGMATKKPKKNGSTYRDRGLHEDLGGKYSNGILYVNKQPFKKSGRGGSGGGKPGKGKKGKGREIKIPGMG